MAPRVGTENVLQTIKTRSYDAVIVGGGLSGLVLAARLSEDPSKRILVLEAGSSHIGDPKVEIPGLMGTLWEDPEYDWGFYCEPQVKYLATRSPPIPTLCVMLMLASEIFEWPSDPTASWKVAWWLISRQLHSDALPN